MFFITLPKSVKVGDTVDVRINKQPARVTRTKTAIVIERDARTIVAEQEAVGLVTYICADADGTAPIVIGPNRVLP